MGLLRSAVLDFIGVGFGPSNLALAVAAREIDPGRRGLFFERRAQVEWHPGLLFDSSRMQISFLKDLATLRNPASPYSFLQYVKTKGRLEQFANLGEFQPTRYEYRDYLRWVAEHFSEQAHYGCAVRSVSRAQLGADGRYCAFKVDVENRQSGEVSSYLTRNVIYAAGGSPRVSDSQTIVHSADFLHEFPQRYGDLRRAYRFAVIGDGQSAGEILLHLLQNYPNAEIHAFISGYALRPVDRSLFVNEAFFYSEMGAFHRSSEADRQRLRRELRNTNYGVIAPELIEQIYRADYLDRVKGVKRLFMHSFAQRETIDVASFNGVVLATGYERSLDQAIFADLWPAIEKDPSGAPRLSQCCRVQTEPQIAGGLYVQGFGEASHGIADTLLSLLPFRSRDIFQDICRTHGLRLRDIEYPPNRHRENDPQKLYAVLERCPFATLICVDGDEPVVTHVPLILDRSKGTRGVLFGHMDRANPHVELLERGKALALFHGPNAYISPHAYKTNQLPTWNSITVHVRGTIRLISNPDELLQGLASISATDTRPNAYRLDLKHPAIDRLVDYIVGFEFEIEEMIGRFKLSQDRNASDQRAATIELLRRSEEGERALIEQALGYALEPECLCLHRLFELQAARAPDAVAIICDEGSLSYSAVNAQANQLAHFLRARGAGPESIVALCLERSPRMLVGLLAILKAGAAFLPLDPDYPQERLDYMLGETASPLILTQVQFKQRFTSTGAQLFCLDADWPQIAASSADNLQTPTSSQNLAYCIFTSGSTGKPKGVAMPHRGIVNHILHMKDALRHTPSDRILQFTAITADGSLQEIFTAWHAGAALVLPQTKAPLIRELMQLLARHRVTVVSVPTAYWHFWVGELCASTYEWPDSVRLVILGGEKVIPEKFRQWRALPCTSHVAWVQDYGPTETTVSCMAFEAAPTDGPEDLSIGRPNGNMHLYIVDEHGDLVPDGEIGELSIAGAGLARGYLNRPDLTAEKFLPNPFGPAGSRLYKTGDLGRVLPNGNVQFLERLDDQVKIMGHRIELGEIESALLRCEDVRQAGVLADEGAPGSHRLIAYVVADGFDESRIRTQLAAILPRTMMPAVFVGLPELPATPGGKIDRAKLRAAAATRVAPALESASDLERAIARLWTQSTERAPRSLDEDFFHAGGDSLRALNLLTRVAAETGVEISAADFFQERTIRSLARLVQLHAGREKRSQIPLRREHAQRQPASHAQQRLWFLDQLQQGAATYSVPQAYRITEAFSAERLDYCLTALIARHEVLRTSLVMTADNELWQEITPAMPIHSEHLHVASFAEAMKLAHEAARRPFDLTRPPLLRSLCIHFAQEVLWVLNLHHAVCDAWSMAVFWRELIALYAGAAELPALNFQYADYTNWQREWLSTADAESDRAFWRAQLAGELPLLQLGRRSLNDSERSTAGTMEECYFGGVLSRSVRETSEKYGTTEYVVALSAFLATLHRFTRQDEIIIGIPVACRSLTETEAVIGYFTNTLPLRITFRPRMSFAELIQQSARSLAAALAHQELPVDQIVDTLESVRQGSTNPLFQAMFVMQTTPLDAVQHLDGAVVEEVIIHSGTSKVDITCSIRSTARGLEGELEYSTEVLSCAEAGRFIQSFRNLLSAATLDASAPIEALSMLTLEEQAHLIRAANSGFQSYPDYYPMHVHFETQALKTPQAIALEIGPETVSYEALNRKANALARQLIRQGMGPERLIGICLERSISMVVALLATLKAGAGFVPLDPDFPRERIQSIVDDARILMVLTPEHFAADISAEDAANPDIAVSRDNVAYVYYTSGSTGKPKGVVLTHIGSMNRLEWLRRRFPVTVGDRVVLKTPLIFDLSIWEIFGPLMAGATVYMADARAESDVPHIGALLSAPRTKFVYFVPSMLEAYLRFAAQTSYPDLRWVAVTGEALPSRLVGQSSRHFTSAELHSTYGQTETSEVAVWEGSSWQETANVPVGRAIGIYRLFLLDSALNPVPPGVPGEICVAGVDGLARGYHDQPELTAEKFVPNPYAVVPGERLYRTGDLGRLSEDGLIEYAGRTDYQVKIRGCRVETSEIEAVLSRHPSVRTCAVIVRKESNGDAQLLAYVVSDRVSTADLAAHAETFLPGYMLPSAYLFLDELPLTPSGKLDRSRLHTPTAADFEARAAHELPQSQLESDLAAIWKQVLGLQNVGRTDNFFALGGNSLKSIQVLARIKDDFSVEIRVRDFFIAPTIMGLAAVVERALVAYVSSLSDSEVEQRLSEVGP